MADDSEQDDLGPDDSAGTAAAASSTRRSPSRLKIALLTLLSVVLVIVLAAGGFALYINHLLDSNVHRSALLPTSSDGPTRDSRAGSAQNILLLGSDSRDPGNIRDASRSDVIQLVHISRDYRSIQVIHFPRDLYVPIPGHGKNKINAAYAYGGAPLLVTTMQNMLGVHIDHVAQTSFTGFAKVTDDLGGVDVYVAQAFDESGFGHLGVGWHHMNGKQALGFVRERHQLKEGDIDRGRDQQAWIKAVLAKTLKTGTLTNPIKLADIIGDLTANTVVDEGMTGSYMRGLALKLRSIRGNDITFYTAPFTGFSYTPAAGDIDVVDQAKMKQLGHALAVDDMSAYQGTRNTIR